MAQILVLHGPNLNLLGEREPDVYGSDTLDTIDGRLAGLAEGAGLTLSSVQSNSEAALIDAVHDCRGAGTRFIIINPAAFTHSSIALRDALAAVRIPFVEVHLSNVHAREPFRQQSYFSDIATGLVCGLGARGYEYALQFAISELRGHQSTTE